LYLLFKDKKTKLKDKIIREIVDQELITEFKKLSLIKNLISPNEKDKIKKEENNKIRNCLEKINSIDKDWICSNEKIKKETKETIIRATFLQRESHLVEIVNSLFKKKLLSRVGIEVKNS